MKQKYILAISSVLFWATAAPVAKLVLGEVPNFQALGVGSVFGLLVMVAVNVLTGKIRQFRLFSARDYCWMIFLGFLGMFLYISLYYYGLTQMSSQEGVIINYLWPIMLVLFACLIEKEPLTFRKAVAMIMSFAGVVVIMSGSAPGEGDHRMAGVLCVVFGGMCFGLYSVLNKRKNYELFFETMVIWATCAVCCFIAGFLTETWVQLSVPALLGVAWSGIFANTVPCLLWALALKDVTNSARIANLAYLVPFLSVILSAVMLHETITARAGLAFVLIIGGILIQSFEKKTGDNSVMNHEPEDHSYDKAV